MMAPLLPLSITVVVPKTWISEPHPIELLHMEGKRRYDHILSSQSKSVEAAIAEYHRRYHREPPKGFDHWA